MTRPLLLLLVAALLTTTTAFAQAAESEAPAATRGSATQQGLIDSPAPAPSLPPDLVRLANGGLVRGVIEVNLPGQYVEIRTSSGELMRFAASEVSYAGPQRQTESATATAPAAAVPAPPAARATVPATSAESSDASSLAMTFESSRPGTRFYLFPKDADLHPVSGEPQLICTAPCERAFHRAGRALLGLAVGDRKPILANLVQLEPGARYFGEYASRRGVRIAGGVILAASLLTAIPLVVVGATASSVCSSSSSSYGGSSTSCEDAAELGMVIPGVVIGIAGTITGLVMLTRSDQASVWKSR